MKISQTVFKYYVQKLDVTDSTNNWLRNTPMMPDVDFLFVATDYQTAGKGQGEGEKPIVQCEVHAMEGESLRAVFVASDGVGGCVQSAQANAWRQ